MRGALFSLEVAVFLLAPFFMTDLGVHGHALHFVVALELHGGDVVEAGVNLKKMVARKYVHLSIVVRMILKRKKTCGC
jgi:hypothetical protein